MNHELMVHRAGLKDEDPVVRILAQSTREDAAC